MKTTILHDDSIIEKPIVKLPDPVEEIDIPLTKSKEKLDAIATPINTNKRDIIIAIVLIVLVVGGLMLVNYFNNKNKENESI